MDAQKTTHIKEEETDCALDERGLMFPEDPLQPEVPGLPIKPDPELKLHIATSENNSHGTLAIDHQQTTYIKEEETDCAPDEPGLMFPEDPLKPEVPGFPIKPDPELKFLVPTSENDSYGTLAMDYQQTTYITEEDTDCAPHEPGLMFPEDPLKPDVPGLPIKADPELKLHVASSENNSVEYPLDISWPTDFIKEEPALNLETEDTINIMEASRNYASNSLSCSVCGKDFEFASRLKRHAVTHTAEKLHSCAQCGKAFGREDCLQRHEAMHEKTQHRCQECGRGFLQPQQLCRHMGEHRGEFPCTYCNKKFPERGRLEEHMRSHTGEQPFQCGGAGCGKVFSTRDGLYKHLRTYTGCRQETGEARPCPAGEAAATGSAAPPDTIASPAAAGNSPAASRNNCASAYRLLQSNERFDFPVEESVSQGVSYNELNIGTEKSQNFIMFHEREEEEKEQNLSALRLTCSLRENQCQTFICSVCQQSFTSKYGLIMHVFVHIDGVEQPKSVCKSCGEVFPSYISLKKHLKISDVEQDSFADKEETFDCRGKSLTQLGTPKDFALIHTESKPRSCDICGKSFTHLSHLKTHALVHTGARPHSCDICGKSFTRMCHLKSHALVHTGITPHICGICGKSFPYLNNLKKHAVIHTGIKPYKCNICFKSFTRLSDVKSHSLIHTGTKSHKCDSCCKSFTRLSNLKIHSLIHTGTKPHLCDICGKSFTRLSQLQSHGLVHAGIKPHKCDICGKSFSSLCCLKIHSLIHSGIKPHKCDICGKSFTRLGTLKNHALTHTGTRPHLCDICGKSFTHLCHLKNHALIHTVTFPQV